MSCTGLTTSNFCGTGGCFDIESEDKLSKLPYMCYSGTHCASYAESALANSTLAGAVTATGVGGSALSDLNLNNVLKTGYISGKKFNYAPFYSPQSMIKPDTTNVAPPSYYDQYKPAIIYSQQQPNNLVVPISIFVLAMIFVIRNKK